MAWIRTFWSGLPAEGRWLLAIIAVQTLGRGLTLPFTIIYLREVRGFDLGVAGALMSLVAIAGFAVTAPSGALVDRFGTRSVLIGGQSAMVIGSGLLAFATGPWTAAVALILIGLNFGAALPAFNTLIAAVVEGDVRQRFFGVHFALMNVGIGVGGVVGGLFVDVDVPATFTTVYLAEAAAALVPMVVLLGPLRHVRGPAGRDLGARPAALGYRAILRQPPVRWLAALTFTGVLVGYGQFQAGVPSFAREVAGVSTSAIGVAYAVNTAMIVALQLPVLSRISGRRRTRVMIVMAGSWAGAWLLLGAAGSGLGAAVATAGLLAFMAVFAFGETLLQPTVPAVTNDLATDDARGRYNAINAAAFNGGAIAAPAVAGLLLGLDLAAAYVGLMIVGCLALCAMALALERRIPPAANGVSRPGGPVVPQAEEEQSRTTGA
ncbi:MFS transporter [Nonomuraea diastatica]|uniref:MFS transporter n=1 Tax=Nonomuraea diastatica TaxID=1848329 RepID=A0A4R4VSR3_9ACTN|nr:MFS transporter [Nonomuraea diastatica]TDD09048.1 MFS transporter [Nonomuraea diastatica]